MLPSLGTADEGLEKARRQEARIDRPIGGHSVRRIAHGKIHERRSHLYDP